MTAAAANGSSKEGLAPILVGLAIGLFLPLGLFLLWRHPTLGKNGKWWAAGIAWACFLVLMGSRAEKDGPAEPNSPPGTQGSGAEASDDSGQPAGKSFSAKQMEGLYKKAFTLRIGMSPDEVFSIMGPPTKREVFNPAEHTLPGLPVVDSRIQDTATWSSSEDPGSAFVMVNFMDGSAHDIIANKKGGKVLSLSASR